MAANYYNDDVISSYGAANAGLGLPLDKSKTLAYERRTMNMPVMLISALIPFCIYAGVCAALSFSLHYDQPLLVKTIVGGAVLLCLFIAHRASQAVSKAMQGLTAARPSWYMFFAVCNFIALIAAVLMGSANYWTNTRPYYEINNLSYYPAVDPAVTTGTQLMDAGRVTFVEGTTIDSAKMMAFKNGEQYCVAPLVSSNQTAATYDIWVVGLDCCATEFHCGEYDNPIARSGLRLVRDDQEVYYRLAVQQAEATYSLPVKHPMFFYWMQDPLSDLAQYHEDAARHYIIGVVAFALFQVAAVVVTTCAFRKFGLA